MNSFGISFSLTLMLCDLISASAQIESTTQTYNTGVSRTDTGNIVDREPLWKYHATTEGTEHKLQHRSLNYHSPSQTTESSTGDSAPNESESSESGEFQSEPLKEFLKSYAEKLKKKPVELQEENDDYSLDGDTGTASGEEKSQKSWDLLNLQRHQHPFEDKKGWVSLEPVPWSISKISKWQSHYKTRPSVNHYNIEKPWQHSYDDPYEDRKPIYPHTPRPYELMDPESSYKFSNKIGIRDNYDVYYINKPNLTPTLPKPSSVFSQKYHSQTSSYMGDPDRVFHSQKPMRNNYKHEENCNIKHTGDIIVDTSAPEFPSSYREGNRRYGTELQPDPEWEDHPITHPFSGNGDWVLLSTTKGYKHSQPRQRSLKLDPESIGAHRAVRLTVLPPLKNSTVNMTTSHGGLLQVESTFQTVEQAHREYTKKQNKKKKKGKKPNKRVTTKRPMTVSRPVNQVKRPSAHVIQSAVTANRRNTPPDSSAVLAAVGAGMIPATMAMLVPIALNGRNKRDVRFVTDRTNSTVEMSLSRSM